MVAYTTTYSFAKPTVGDDEDVWGGYLNGNFDSIESLLKGTTALTAINVTGNITVGGTVDGRDIAADGSKLDGIESGATADQTKADIDALGIDADTVDSLHASSFVRSDADDTISGALTFTDNIPLSFENTVTGLTYYPQESGAYSSRYFLQFNTTNNASYPFLTNRTPSGDVVIKTGTTAGGSEIERIRFNGGDSTQDIVISNATLKSGSNVYWHSGNDGSGSGLDADLLDGYHASTGSTTSSSANTIVLRNWGGDIYARYMHSNYLYMDHGAATRSSDTIFYSSGDNYLRKNNATGFKNSLGLGTGDSPTFSNVSISGVLYHDGDLDTNLTFTDNTITLNAGGSAEVTVTSTGVQLGDTGNGYFQPVSGHFGSIQIDGGAHNGYEGYSIGGRAVFMHDNANATGIYDDVNNYWMFYGVHGAGTYMYYNGAQKFNTTSTGANINGDLNAVDNVYVAGNIYHEGDTDTYVGFATDTINVYAGNVHAAQIDGNGLFLPNGSLREDYDALSGTTPTCNVNSGGAFSLTMSDNTTFTFTSPTSGYSTGFILQLTGHASTAYTVDFGTNNNVKWAGGTAPDAPAAGETDIYVFWTRDGGTTWYGVLSVDAAA